MNTKLLAKDARNRALRTFLQGAAYVVVLAVGLVIYNAFADADGWSDIDWSRLAFSAVQAAVMAFFAFLMRRKIDGSPVPTPLPPEPVPEPNEDADLDVPADFEYQPERELVEDPEPRRAAVNPYGDQPGVRPDGSIYQPGRE